MSSAPASVNSPMRLSRLVAALKPSETIAAAAKAKELKGKGVTVHEFTLGEPDFNTPEHICEAAIQAMRDGHTHYTPATGIPQLKQAVCRAYERDYGLKYDPAQVIISNGAKHAIHNVLAAMCGPGDEVIIPAPYWVSYSALVELTGAIPVIVDTTPESGFCLSPEQFAAKITPRTRLLMLNNPCNPTGAAYPVETLEGLAKVAVAHNIPVLSDEIYEKLIYPGSEFRSFASFGEDVKNLTVTVSGVSKAYAMTGWRIGWSIAPLSLTKGMNNLQSQETSNPCSVSQYAAVAALDGSQECVVEMLKAFTERREYVLSRLRAIPDLKFCEPGGAFYAFFDVSAYFGKPLGKQGTVVHNATEFCDVLLEQPNIATVSGDAFGAPGYVRWSFATNLDNLKNGFDRLTAFLNP
ncbi:MAG: pyridoxal phosphate-dependent aminotransferase [Planctomycetaceae bacterium]